jgi:two-component system response regulator AtoC
MSEGHVKGMMETENETPAGAQVSGGTVARPEAPGAPWAALRSLRAETEIHAISRALEESGWNRKRAAKLLSISYRGLLYKIRQYNITPAQRNNLAQAPRA